MKSLERVVSARNVSWRMILLGGALAAVGLPGCVPVEGSGRGGPWGDGGGGGGGSYDYPRSEREYDYEDQRAWEREHPRYDCDKVDARIRYDRGKLDEIDPSKHPKASRWFQEDLISAQRDQAGCSEYQREDRERGEWQRRAHEREDEDRRERHEADCDKLKSRIDYDRSKLAEVDPREHPKATQWFRDDLVKAQRSLDDCRRR